MVFTKRVYSTTKKVFIYGSGTFGMFFLILLGLVYLGINVQTSGDQVCGSECISYFNISLKDYSLCFGSTFEGVMTEPNVRYEIQLKESKEIITNNYYCQDTNLTNYCFKLSSGIGTRCYYNETTPTKYTNCKTGWVKEQGKVIINWNPYEFKANTCLDKNKIYEFKLIGYKKPEQTVKWGLSLQGTDIDPFWYGITSPTTQATEIFMELGSRVNITANFTSIYSLCYQETANVSTICGGLDTGSYNGAGWSVGTGCNGNCIENTYDGDWDTWASKTGINDAILYINYTKPANAVSAIWQVKHSGDVPDPRTMNLTIPSDCFNQNKLQLSVNVTYDITRVSYYCYNGIDFQIIYHNPNLDDWFYEEAIWWNISSALSVCVDIDHPDYSERYDCGSPNANFLFNISYFRNNQFNDTNTFKNLTYKGPQNQTIYIKQHQYDEIIGASINMTGAFYNGTNPENVKIYINNSLSNQFKYIHSGQIIDNKFGNNNTFSNLNFTTASTQVAYLRIPKTANIVNVTFNLSGYLGDKTKSGFKYTQELKFNELSGWDLDNYTICTVLKKDPRMDTQFKDIRFWNAAETKEYPYWIEETNATAAKVCIRITDTITGGQNITVYNYFGNSSYVDTTSNKDATFLLYDDMSDSSNWILDAGSITFNGTAALFGTSGDELMHSKIFNTTFRGMEIEYRYKVNTIFRTRTTILNDTIKDDTSKQSGYVHGSAIPIPAAYVPTSADGGKVSTVSVVDGKWHVDKLRMFFTTDTQQNWTGITDNNTIVGGLFDYSRTKYINRTMIKVPAFGSASYVDVRYTTGFAIDYVQIRHFISPEPYMTNHSKQYYPSDVYLEVGDIDGIKEFNHPGSFNHTNNKTNDLSIPVKNYLSTCTADADGYCLIPLYLVSSEAGIIQLSDLIVNYTYDPGIISLNSDLIRNFLGNSSGYADIPIKIENQKNGSILVNDIRLDYAGGNKTTNILVYEAHINESCYQEFANVSTDCGGLSTGSYWNNSGWYTYLPEGISVDNLYDGDWNTGSDSDDITDGILIINYTKPANAVSAVWQVKHDKSPPAPYTEIKNLTIPSDCFSQNPLRLKVNSTTDSHDIYSCHNDSDFQIIYDNYDTGLGAWFYEEAIWWTTTWYNKSNNDTLKIHTYYSKWDFHFPKYVNWLEFIPKTPTSKNVTPYGQTPNTPIFNLTTYNYGDRNADLSIYLNETHPCVNLSYYTNSTNPKSLNFTYFNVSETPLENFDINITSGQVKYRPLNMTWLNFDGSGDYISAYSFLDVDTGDNLGFSTWFNLSDGTITKKAFFGIYTTFYFGVQNYTSLFCEIRNSAGYQINTTFNSPINLNDSKWHNTMCTYDGDIGNISIYFDGFIGSSYTELVGDSGTQSAAMYIGKDVNGIYGDWKGELDEIRLYKAISGFFPNETTALEINSSGRFPNSSLPSTNLILWYSFRSYNNNLAHNRVRKTSQIIYNAIWKYDENVTNLGYQTNISIVNMTNARIKWQNGTIINTFYTGNKNLTFFNNDTIYINKDLGILENQWIKFQSNAEYLNNSKLWLWADFGCNATTWQLWNPDIYIRGCCKDCICSEEVS